MADVPFSTDPLPQVVIDYIDEVIDGPDQFDDQLEAYRKLCKRHSEETNPLRRVTMQSLLNFVILNEPAMKPTYAFGELLDYVFDDERKAEKKLYPRELYQIVTTIAQHVVHTKGRGKSTGWTVHRGWTGYGKGKDSKRPLFSEWTATEVKGAYLLFGAHQFFVGALTERILEALEERYGISFRKLERERGKGRKAVR